MWWLKSWRIADLGENALQLLKRALISPMRELVPTGASFKVNGRTATVRDPALLSVLTENKLGGSFR